MTRDRDQLARQLEEPIPEHAKFTRKGGAGELTYVDGAFVIDSLNFIFGFDGWSFTGEGKILEWRLLDEGRNKGRWEAFATFTGTLAIHVREEAVELQKTGSACGNGLSFNLGEAMHFAISEAETDALKRAARLLGGHMGLELYRKHGNQALPPREAKPYEDMGDTEQMFAMAIDKLTNRADIPTLVTEIKQANLTDAELDELRFRMQRKMEELNA